MMEQERFEFCDRQFFPEKGLLIRVRDHHPFSLTPQQSRFLELLILKSGELATYEEIRHFLWPPDVEMPVKSRAAIQEIKSGLCKHLGRYADAVETISRKGYRLNAPVAKHPPIEYPESFSSPATLHRQNDAALNAPEQEAIACRPEMQPAVWQRQPLFAGHTVHALVGCALYAGLFAEAVFLEISYQYNQFELIAWKAAPVAFCWI